jgi:hypothetical protein
MSALRALWTLLCVSILTSDSVGWYEREHGVSEADRLLDDALARRGHPPIDWAGVS